MEAAIPHSQNVLKSRETVALNALELLKKENAIDYVKKEPEELVSKNMDEYDVIVAMKE